DPELSLSSPYPATDMAREGPRVSKRRSGSVPIERRPGRYPFLNHPDRALCRALSRKNVPSKTLQAYFLCDIGTVYRTLRNGYKDKDNLEDDDDCLERNRVDVDEIANKLGMSDEPEDREARIGDEDIDYDGDEASRENARETLPSARVTRKPRSRRAQPAPYQPTYRPTPETRAEISHFISPLPIDTTEWLEALLLAGFTRDKLSFMSQLSEPDVFRMMDELFPEAASLDRALITLAIRAPLISVHASEPS
ncbi:unnamed protein product, partial [Mycena citricolor]